MVKRQLLLVEDDAELRAALREALTEGGHDVVVAGDGRGALAELRACRADIIILDLMMPVMDGWQFRVEQRRDPALADIPIIAISASSSPSAAAVDADVYIQKPLDAATLLRAIEDVLLVRQRRGAPAEVAQTERLAALGTLAAGVAHEINNPLTYVLLHVTQASRLLPKLATDQNRKSVEEIETLMRGALEGVERIRTITSGIRTFSRADELPPAPLDVKVAVEAALKLVTTLVRHRARVRQSYSATAQVLANEGRLAQVFLNLLTNAAQALPEGEADRHEIGIATFMDREGRVVVEISDDGAGIPAHLIGRIFEPFFSTKPVGQGTGLGLSISRGIVMSFGGELTVTSDVGQGATFRVTLPAARGSGTHAINVASRSAEVPTRRPRPKSGG